MIASTTVELLDTDVRGRPRNRLPRRAGTVTFRRPSLPTPVGPKAVPVAGLQRPLEVKVASEPAEWEQAYKLVSAKYQAVAAETLCPGNLRFTPFHALPETVTLVAKFRSQVVATFSIVLDNTLLGLPGETLYADEIAALRRSGRRLLETISLAEEGLTTREFYHVFLALIRLGMQYHRSQGGDTYVITCSPHHRNFYCKVLGFQPLGACKPYEQVEGHPTESFWLDNDLLRRKAPKMHQHIFGEPLPAQALIAPRMPRHLIRDFTRRSRQGDMGAVKEILDFEEHFGGSRRW